MENLISCQKCGREDLSRVIQQEGPGKIYKYFQFPRYNKVERRKKLQPRHSYCYVLVGQ